jgi:uncharacterized protein (UPF0332 family)
MMEYADDIKRRWEEAAKNLQAARDLLAGGQYDEAALRASDAGFHTAAVLLLDEEIEAGRHGDVVTLIDQIFVQGRRLTQEQGEKLRWLLQFRNAGQGSETRALIPGEAQKAVEFAGSFFDAARVILET